MKNSLFTIILSVFFILPVNLFAQEVQRQLKGTVSEVSINGEVTGREIKFSIYLPEGYNNTSRKYPVVYHLHGRGGSHQGNQISIVPAAFESAKSKGLIGDVIIVFPDGYVNSSWGDAYDGTKPAETNVIREIIPYVDKTYKTVAEKSHRFIQGFSMGASGALKFIAKFPELFSKAYMYDAPFVSWERMSADNERVTSTYNNDKEYFDRYTSWKFLKENRDLFTKSMRLGLVVGGLKAPNERMHEFLDSLSIPHSIVRTDCKHVLPCLIELEGDNAAAFYYSDIK